MSFFCAGSSGEAVKKKWKNGSKPGPPPVGKSSSNGRVTNPFQEKKALPTIPFSDQPNTRRMIVLQDYQPSDNRGLFVKRGEQVQVLNQEGTWFFVRNENKKEGFVPSSHLVAPYTSTRSRKANTHPIRPVASGSSINDLDPMGSRVPMYPSHSAGVPRHMPDEHNRANSYNRRGSSPQVLSTNDTSNNNNAQLSQGMMQNGMTVAKYEQKYSPSSSSGVASMNGGPSSPSYQSPPEHSSQENIRAHSSGSSLTQERTSLSSIEENGTEYPHNGYHVTNGGAMTNEDVGMRSYRATSESNLVRMKARPLPHPPPRSDKEGVYMDQKMNHIYSTITNGEGPPPVPPRARPLPYSTSQGEQYFEGDEYIAPADAVLEQPGPHLQRPRVRSLSDVRSRDGHRQVQSNVEYSEVYQGKIKPPKQNGYYHSNDTSSEHSEGSSNRSSSKRGGSSKRGYIDRTAGSREFISQDRRSNDAGYLAPVPVQSSATRIAKFRKCLWGVFVVTSTFSSNDENELSVEKGDHVSVWNQDDQDWFWIVKHSTSEEGFVPSCFLKEIVASEGQTSNVPTLQQQNHSRPPLPPKQYLQPSHHVHSDDQSQFRHRASSQESRSTNQIARSRGRLNSDGSSKSRSSLKANHSVTSVEKMEIPESPPNTPPPPYSEYDSQHTHQAHASHQSHSHQAPPTRHFSLSQQHETVPSGYTQILRTRSHGQVMRPHRHGNPQPLPPLPRRDDRLTSPAEVYNLRSPSAVDGGTLV